MFRNLFAQLVSLSLIVMFSALINGCGKTGDLYLPDQPSVDQPTQKTVDKTMVEQPK